MAHTQTARKKSITFWTNPHVFSSTLSVTRSKEYSVYTVIGWEKRKVFYILLHVFVFEFLYFVSVSTSLYDAFFFDRVFKFISVDSFFCIFQHRYKNYKHTIFEHLTFLSPPNVFLISVQSRSRNFLNFCCT